jgi:hypothetical protein
MRLTFAAALLAALAATACEGTKVRLVNPHPPGTAAYLYDEAFYSLRYNHDLFQRYRGAPLAQRRAAMADIMKCLETMLGLLEEPFHSDLQPIVDAHRRIQTNSVDKGSMNAGILMTMDNLWKQVDKQFYPEGVKLKAAPAAGTQAATPPPAAAAPATPAAPAATPPAPVPGWMAATAWRQSHAALAAAWPGKPKEAAAAFARAREALAAVKGTATEEAAPMLQIYLNEYDRLAAQTANFSKVPAGQTAEGVSKALGAVGKGVETHLPKR